MPIITEAGLKVTVGYAQRKILLMLAARGKRMDMKLGDNVRPEVVKLIADLDKMGLIVDTSLVGSDRHDLLLTDLGAQVVDQMRKQFAVEVATIEAEPLFRQATSVVPVFKESRTCPDCGQEAGLEERTLQGVGHRHFASHVRFEQKPAEGGKSYLVGYRCPGSGKRVEDIWTK